MPIVPQNTMTIKLKIMIVQSTYLWNFVLAIYFKWNIAGNVNAIGVHVTAPNIPKNLPMLSPTSKVTTTVKSTSKNRVKFLVHYLFFVFGQLL